MSAGVQLHPVKGRRRSKRWIIYPVLLAISFGVAGKPAYNGLRAAALLTRVADPNNQSWIATFQKHSVQIVPVQMQTSLGPISAKMYIPHGVSHAPAMVIIHGVHHLGIEEPRLVSFATAFASSGIIVCTPQIASLADYTIEPSAITLIGESVQDVARHTGASRVGLMGLSFAGGLALSAAADSRYSPYIAYTVAVGAHHDLARVIRFFASDEIEGPDHLMVRMKAHEYGLLVAAYSHVGDFFGPDDEPAAREALRQLLYENAEASQAAAQRLSPAGIDTINLLYAQSKASVAPIILDKLPQYESELAEVSPRGRLALITAPVFLLHGAADNVIPPTETQWIASEIPPHYLKASLISPAISHVEVGGEPTVQDKAKLVHWLSEFLAEAHAAPESTKSPVPALVSTQAQ